MPPKAVSFPVQNQSSESYGRNARQIVPSGMEELSKRERKCIRGGLALLIFEPSIALWPAGLIRPSRDIQCTQGD